MQIAKPASLQRLHRATQHFDRVPTALKMWRPLCQPFPMLSLFICLVHVGLPRLALLTSLSSLSRARLEPLQAYGICRLDRLNFLGIPQTQH
jgi:hypothetical protein